MMKNNLLLIILLFTHSLITFAQVNIEGYPFFRNYSPKEYKGQNPNFSIGMNSKGIIYVANTEKGVMEFDGSSWRHIPVANNSTCRAIAIDNNDIVYVGAVGDFGYLLPDKTGTLQYNSIIHLLEDKELNISNIWKTYADDNGAYYCGTRYIFHFSFPNNLTVHELPEGSFLSSFVNNRLLISNYLYGLLELKNNEISPVKGGEYYIDKDIFQILPYRRNQLLIVASEGLFIYDYKKGSSEEVGNNRITEKTNNFIKENFVYNACVIDGIGYAFATITAGIIITDNRLRLKNHFNVKTGLINESASDVYFDNNQGVLWSIFESGISSIELNSPFTFFSKESNINGTVLSSIKHNGIFYVGTYSGLSSLKYDSDGLPNFKEIESLKSKTVYQLISTNIENNNILLAVTSSDIYTINNDRAIPLGFPDITTYHCIQSQIDNKQFYTATSKGMYNLTYNKGKWSIKQIHNFEKDVFSITESTIDKAIWGSTAADGLIRYSYEGESKYFGLEEGLPTLTDIFVTAYNDTIIACTIEGLFFYCTNNKKFYAYDPFNYFHTYNKPNIKFIIKGYLNSYFVNINNQIHKINHTNSGFIIDSISFKRLPEMAIESIYTESSGISWINSSEGLIGYNNLYNFSKRGTFNTLIRRVNSYDNTIFGGTYYKEIINNNDTLLFPTDNQSEALIPIINFKNNNITFTFSGTHYHGESSTMYSYMLEGFDKTWSDWSNDNRAVYTNISEGSYTFKVKSKNIYLDQSGYKTDSLGSYYEYSFVILPPWYRTIWAYISYIIIAIILLVTTVKIYTRKLEADKKRLEGIVEERTAEVVRQKDEILEKNVEIEHKNKDITDSIVYAQRIQEALLPSRAFINIPTIDLFVYFRPKDIVSGDYYFMRQIHSANVLVATAADCTGHGVPGAFMSMLGMSFLNELITKPEINHSDTLLYELRKKVITSLNPNEKSQETKDGMDMALIAYFYKENYLEYSGANNPLYLIRKGELIEYKADKMPIGLHDRKDEPFTRHEITPEDGDIIYMSSDGFPDQFGGEKGKKYMSKRFKEFLLTIYHLPLKEQEELIATEALRWRGEIEQIDDQVVMGIKFNLK